MDTGLRESDNAVKIGYKFLAGCCVLMLSGSICYALLRAGPDRVRLMRTTSAVETWIVPYTNDLVAMFWFDPSYTNVDGDVENYANNTNNGVLAPTVATGPTWVEVGTNECGRSEHAFEFDGLDDRIKIRGVTAFQIPSNKIWSCSLWVKRPTSADTDALIGTQRSSGNAEGFVLGVVQNQTYFGLTKNEGGGDRLLVGENNNVGNLPSNNWAHVWYTYDGSATATGIVVGRNGITVDKEIFSDALTGQPTNNLECNIGSREGAGNPVAGFIDNVYIYTNRVFTTNDAWEFFANTHPLTNKTIRPTL